MNRFHEPTNRLLKRAVPWSVLWNASQAWRRKEAKSCLLSSLIPLVLVTRLVDEDIERQLQIAGFGQKASRKASLHCIHGMWLFARSIDVSLVYEWCNTSRQKESSGLNLDKGIPSSKVHQYAGDA